MKNVTIMNFVAIHKIIKELDGEVEGAVGQLAQFDHATRPVHLILPGPIYSELLLVTSIFFC